MKIILASSSPRRRQLLKQLDLEFDAFSPNVDEEPVSGEEPRRMVERLSYEKAKSVLKQVNLKVPFLSLAADTTVVSDNGRILGKPADKAEAKFMLSVINGTFHDVWTGYCLFPGNLSNVTEIVRSIRTRVYFKKLSDLEINRYLETGESLDKAGAYGAQGFGAALIEKIEGCYFNVVGLPLSSVIADLKIFGMEFLDWKSDKRI